MERSNKNNTLCWHCSQCAFRMQALHIISVPGVRGFEPSNRQAEISDCASAFRWLVAGGDHNMWPKNASDSKSYRLQSASVETFHFTQLTARFFIQTHSWLYRIEESRCLEFVQPHRPSSSLHFLSLITQLMNQQTIILISIHASPCLSVHKLFSKCKYN